MNPIRVEFAHRHNLLGLGMTRSAAVAGAVEVLFGHAVDEIAGGVGDPGPHEGHVGTQGRYKDKGFAVDELDFGIGGNVGAGRRRRRSRRCPHRRRGSPQPANPAGSTAPASVPLCAACTASGLLVKNEPIAL